MRRNTGNDARVRQSSNGASSAILALGVDGQVVFGTVSSSDVPRSNVSWDTDPDLKMPEERLAALSVVIP